MSNGFKVWHYTSTLMYETFYKDATSLGPGEELWEATWRPNSELGKDLGVNAVDWQRELHRVRTLKAKQNSRTFQGFFVSFPGVFILILAIFQGC